MDGAYGEKKSEGLPDIGGRNDEQFADQGTLQFFVAAGAFAEGQNRGGCRDDVYDAD